jgi:hypothetical protein
MQGESNVIYCLPISFGKCRKIQSGIPPLRCSAIYIKYLKRSFLIFENYTIQLDGYYRLEGSSGRD